MENTVPDALRRLEDAFHEDTDTLKLLSTNDSFPDKLSEMKPRRRSRIEELMEKHLPEESTTNAETLQEESVDAHAAENCFKLYRPWNRSDFLARLHTFNKVYNWFAKPDFLSPIQASLSGWYNVDRDRLQCDVCQTTFTHSAVTADVTAPPTTRSQFLRLQHKDSCPWREGTCKDSLANIPRFEDDALQLAHCTATTRQLMKLLASLNTYASGSSPPAGESNALVVTLSSLQVAITKEIEAMSNHAADNTKARSGQFHSPIDILCNQNNKDISFLQCLLRLGEASSGQQCNDASTSDIDTAVQQLLHNLNVLPNSSQTSIAAISLLIALCGWEIVHSAASNSDANNTTEVNVHCSLCQRNLKLAAGTSFDPVKQHRVYCPWIVRQSQSHLSSSNEGDEENVKQCQSEVGWRHCSVQLALRLRAAFSSVNISTSTVGTKRTSAELDVGNEADLVQGLTSSPAKKQKADTEEQALAFGSASDVFLRIRNILHH
jgi:hypothetical protein